MTSRFFGYWPGFTGASSPYASYAFAADFKNGLYRDATGDKSAVTEMAGYTYTRSGAKSELNGSSAPLAFAANVPGIVPNVGYWSRGALTNLLLRSQEFDHASWTKNNTTVTANSITAPDGALTADLFTEASGSAIHALYGTAAITTAATTYTCSVFLKIGTRRYVSFRGVSTGSGSPWVTVDLQNGTIVANAAVASSSITSVGNGWYRVTIVCVANSGTGDLVLAGSDASTAPGTGVAIGESSSGSATFYAWQAQLLAGNHPDGGPIIVTTSATAALGADVLSTTSPITADEDFIAMAVVNFQLATNQGRVLSLSDGTTTNVAWLERSGAGIYQIPSNAGGVAQATVAGDTSATSGRTVLLMRRKAGKWSVGSKRPNGAVLVGSETTATFPSSISRLDVGSRIGATQPDSPVEFVGIRRGTFSDAELTALLTAA